MEPSPPQVGHAPNGELNENARGFSSSKERPQSGQAFFSEKTSGDGWPAAGSSTSTEMRPLPVLRPSSTESVRRVTNCVNAVSPPSPFSAFPTLFRRSTTTSMVWAFFLSRAGTSSTGYVAPSTRTRANPARVMSASVSSWRPLRPCTTGA